MENSDIIEPSLLSVQSVIAIDNLATPGETFNDFDSFCGVSCLEV